MRALIVSIVTAVATTALVLVVMSALNVDERENGIDHLARAYVSASLGQA